MNKEIKEILDRCTPYLFGDEIDKLLDYITNLQKTNKNHSKKLIELGNKLTNLQQENERLKEKLEARRKICIEVVKREQDYKSRCEKAIEILKKLDLDKYTYTKENRKHTINYLLNILYN